MSKFRYPNPIRQRPHNWKVQPGGTWSGLNGSGLCIDLELWLERLASLDPATLPALPAEGIPAGPDRVPRLLSFAQAAIEHRARLDETAQLRRNPPRINPRTYIASYAHAQQ